jgi:hypothetical protein
MSIDLQQAAAEQVRAHLVMVRGGAPFLSPLDSKLLVEWLDSAVPVDVILTAIEDVASRRSKARMKNPLTLRAIKAVVAKGRKRPKTVNHTGSPNDTAPLTRLVQRLEKAQEPELQLLAPDFQALEAAGLQGAELLAAVLTVARQFHEGLWERSDQKELKAQAEAEVGELRDMMSEARFECALEEVARDNLRKRYKLLSAPTLSQAFRT